MHLSLIYSNHLKDKKKFEVLITFFFFELMRYIDSSYTENLEDKKSKIRYCYFINIVVISWYSKKQKTILIFIFKAKYITFRHII